jgi:hypothetical protein
MHKVYSLTVRPDLNLTWVKTLAAKQSKLNAKSTKGAVYVQTNFGGHRRLDIVKESHF